MKLNFVVDTMRPGLNCSEEKEIDEFVIRYLKSQEDVPRSTRKIGGSEETIEEALAALETVQKARQITKVRVLCTIN